ncbi:hypothetical protein EV586_102387 [Tumebacillus sp. BK434]|uniref:hypothetical protein n=1 Tax=Tumebacillus sp. BK434 TaxID=2512169 RepID=UPI00104C2375|nr:hypothetical protein [Tumebacillus sp. BK434]TCP57940.1 hypothetical protein EV586_102387 [Tumebacillus sp. BK434]
MKNKMYIAIAAAAGCFLLSGGIASAAPAVAYWEFTGAWGTGGNTYAIKTNWFTVTNSAQVVTIAGWQDVTSLGNANIDYTLVRYGFLGNTPVGMKNFNTNYPKSGVWYNYTFTNARKGEDHRIELIPHSSAGMIGAGNAYDGY